jgi:hypothetical protein
MNKHPYGFTVYVEPRKRLSYKQYTGKIIYKYECLTDEEEEKDEILKWLSSVCGMDVDCHYEKPEDIVYTKEIGLFFYNAIMFIMKLTDNLNNILDKNKIDFNKIKKLNFLPKEKNNG